MSPASERIDKAQRWLDLIAYLVGRRTPALVEEIMENVPAYAESLRLADEESDPKKAKTARDSVRRKFERDKDELREAGIPIESRRQPIDYGTSVADTYLLSKRDFHLPYLRIAADAAGVRPPRGARSFELQGEEAATAFRALEEVAETPGFPLREEARSTWRKLSFDLAPPPGDPVVLFADRADAGQVAVRTRAITDALLRRKVLSFRYHGIYRGTPTDRRVRPYGLFFQHGHWYLVGFDEVRADLRLFRADRMDTPVVNDRAPHTPDYDIPEDFSLADFRDRDAWNLGSDDDAMRASVQFDFPLSLWAERNGYGELDRSEAGGASVRTFEIRQVDPFLRWILSRGGDARVIEPPELRERVKDLARETLAVYGAEGGEDA